MIRFYNKNDKNKLIALLQLNVPKYFDESEIKDFIDYLEDEVEDYFVIEKEGQIVGSGGINYFLADNLARISWDIIHPNFHRQGLGGQLVVHRINHIKQNPNIHTIVVRTSQVAYLFYQKMGFELEKMEADFWAKGFDLYQMTMKL